MAPPGRVVFFFPHNPLPPSSGAHHRCLEMLAGLRDLGAEVVFASATHTSESAWTRASIESLRRDFGCDVQVYKAGLFDRVYRGVARRVHRVMGQNLSIRSGFYTPPGMRRWFRTLTRRFAADVVIVSYVFWDGLTRGTRSKGCRYVMDTIDLMAAQIAMRERLRSRLPSSTLIDPAHIADDVIDERFFAGIATPGLTSEFRIFDRYDCTIAITDAERDLIRDNSPRTKVTWIPITLTPAARSSTCTGPALFPTGPNPFNLQGYLYFVRRVLPVVLGRLPGFTLTVTGSVCDRVPGQEGVALAGFVQDLGAVLATARFVVCPIMGLTGQQVKIVEAMAHGVPVIALRPAAVGSPIRHGINGFIADDAEQFAEYVCTLWADAELCRRMGEAARETVAREFSHGRLVAGLAEACGGALAPLTASSSQAEA